MPHIIYKHSNTISGKCYVGKTKKSIEKRWKGHVSIALAGSVLHFHAAIRAYPLDSWTHEVLETVETLSEANERESAWIAHYRSNDPTKGYNMTTGGDGGRTCDPAHLSSLFSGVPKTAEHRQRLREAQKQYWENNPDDQRKQQLAKRNASPEMREAARNAQIRRWEKFRASKQS